MAAVAAMVFLAPLLEAQSGPTSPQITTQPPPQTVVAGGTTTFTVLASGNPAPTYQWQVSVDGGSTLTNLGDMAPYSGAATATLTITGATGAMNGDQYECVASNGISPAATSNPATLTVNWLSAVLLQSPSATVIAGQPVSFSVGVNGYPAPTYQWQVSTTGGSAWTNLTDGNGISGSSTATLVVAAAPVAWSGDQYQVIATNGSGSVTSTPVTLTVTPLPPANAVAYDFITLAGTAGQVGSVDGTGSAALFQFPSGVAVDDAGNVYVGDTTNDTIRKITSAGVVTTLAGTAGSQGSADGMGSAALFNFPASVAVDGLGNVYVADPGNDIIRKITSAGVVTTLAGTAGQSGNVDGTGSAALFHGPYGVAADRVGNVYVADSNGAIRKITPTGVVTTLAGMAGQSGSADGTGSAAQFFEPYGVAVDGAGNVYVADSGNNTIRRITSAGEVTTLAGTAGQSGSTDGTGSAALFNYPWNVAVDSVGNVYVADTGNATIRKITSAGEVTTLAGTAGQSGSTDGTGSAALFGYPGAVAVDGSGNVYVADCTMGTIRKGIPSIVGPALILTQPQNATIIAGQNTGFYVSAAGTAPLNYQWQVSMNGGSTWVNLTDTAPYSGTATATLAIAGATAAINGDQYSCLVSNSVPSNVASNTVVLTVIPSAATAEAGEGVISSGFTAAWSSVNGATGYRLDVSTNSAFSSFVTGYQNLDVGNIVSVAISGLSANTTYYYRVRAYDSAGNGANSSTITVTTTATIMVTAPLTVSTLAGTVLSAGSSDGTGSAARFYYPAGVAADSAGNLYVADTDNHTIRKIVVSTGAVTTLAGLAGNSGSVDGTNSAARFNNPSGVAVDGAGNVYVADTMNNTLRMVTPQGVVTTLAGSPGAAGSTDDTGSAARFQGPQGLAIDTSSNLYVADTNNHTIRKVVPSTGVVTTLAGSAGNFGSADGLGSQGRFNYPSGVAVDGSGNLYVADTENHTIRQILPSGMVNTLAGVAGYSGGADGTGSAARFDSPSDLAVDSSGNVYVADTDNFTIREVVPSTGAVTTLAGLAGTSGSTDGLGSAVRFFHPAGIAVDSSSNLYLADTDNDTVRVGLISIKPAIQTQPQSQTVTAGTSVQFSVTASGRPAVTYQWNFNGTPINGSTGNTYSLSNAQSGNAGNYSVVVSNVTGSVTSNPAALTVNAVAPPPSHGHGGGAPSDWFYGALLLLAAVRGILGWARVEVGRHR